MTTLIDKYLQFNDRSKTVLTTFSKDYTLVDFEERITFYTKLLEKRDISGMRVVIILPNVFQFLSLTMAINKLGAVVVPLSWQYRSDDLGELLRFIDPHIVFSISNYGDFSIIDEVKQWAISVEHNTTVFQTKDGFLWSEASFGNGEKPLEESKVDFICCTSGSTGVPKALMLNIDSIEYTARYPKELAGLKQGDRMFTLTPTNVVLGLAYLFAGLREGLQIIYPDSFDLPTIVDLLKKTKPNIILLTPSTLKAVFIFAEKMAPEIMNEWEFIMIGGEPVTEGLLDQVPVRDECIFFGGYGNSETGATLYCDVRKKIEFSTFSDAEYKISKDGELLLRTPGTFIGYYKQKELTSQVFTSEGWFKTGDLVKENRNGKLEIIGRLKDMIKKGGQQIIPGEIEKIILQHPNVKQAAVIGVPHSVFGEQVVAFVVLDRELTINELFNHCTMRIARYKIPDTIEIVSDMPIRQGKIDKITLKDSYLSGKGVGNSGN